MPPLSALQFLDFFRIFHAHFIALLVSVGKFPKGILAHIPEIGFQPEVDYFFIFFPPPRGAEIDFVIQREGQLIPIEVKSADNTKAKSLNVYMQTFHPAYAIKLSAKNFGFEDGKKTVPLYAAFCI